MTADNIEHVISYWVIFQKFHSPTLAGFAVISHWVPFLLFSVYAGSLADRYDCRRLIQASQALFMLASLAWGVLFLTDTLQVWHAVVHPAHPRRGGRDRPRRPASSSSTTWSAPSALPSAIRLNASSRYLAILLGPAVGGGLMLLAGPAWGLLANVLLYLPFVCSWSGSRTPGHARRAPARDAGARCGLAHTWPPLRRCPRRPPDH